MKILITGAEGQLGRGLQENPSTHILFPLSHSLLNITDSQAVEETLNRLHPDFVINAAAYNRVDDAETHSKEAFLINEIGPKNLALSTAKRNIPLLHISTDYVFDGKKRSPYVESDQTNPLSVYGKSKWAGEQAVQNNNPKHFIVRTAWLYGVHGKNFIKTIYALSKKDKVSVVNDQFGSPTYVRDLVTCIWLLIESQHSFGIYHMAGKGFANWHAFTTQFYSLRNIKTAVIPVSTHEFPRPAPRPAYSVLSTLYKDLELPDWEIGLSKFCKEFTGAKNLA